MSGHKTTPVILAGDIGGTNTRLGLFYSKNRYPESILTKTYASQEAPDFESILHDFVQHIDFDISGACFGVAGLVENGTCRTTNIPWEISENKLKRLFKWPRIFLLNDIHSMASALPLLRNTDLFVLNKGFRDTDTPVVIIAPGTGLGMAFRVRNNKEYLTIPSEGGHMDFAPTSKSQDRLWGHLHKTLGHVSIERVLSGPGLINIYHWIKDTGKAAEPPMLTQRLKNEDPAQVISDSAINENIPISVMALEMFVSILGAVAGNLALTGLTRGGVYLGGGIVPKILPALKTNTFMSAFENKGRFKKTIRQIPVKAIIREHPALLGAAAFILTRLNH